MRSSGNGDSQSRIPVPTWLVQSDSKLYLFPDIRIAATLLHAAGSAQASPEALRVVAAARSLALPLSSLGEIMHPGRARRPHRTTLRPY